jgi:hypothetical protein
VELIKPGLMMGYIERFDISETGEMLGPSHEFWEPICRRALALWRHNQQAAVPAVEGNQQHSGELPRITRADMLDTAGILNGTEKVLSDGTIRATTRSCLVPGETSRSFCLKLALVAATLCSCGANSSLEPQSSESTSTSVRAGAGGRVVVEIGSQADGAFLFDLCNLVHRFHETDLLRGDSI